MMATKSIDFMWLMVAARRIACEDGRPCGVRNEDYRAAKALRDQWAADDAYPIGPDDIPALLVELTRALGGDTAAADAAINRIEQITGLTLPMRGNELASVLHSH
jgi:hypothetical protein